MGKELDHFFPGFRFELTANQIVFALQVGLHPRIGKKDLFLPLQKLQTEVSGAQVSGNADQIAYFSGIPVADFSFLALANGGYANDEPFL